MSSAAHVFFALISRPKYEPTTMSVYGTGIRRVPGLGMFDSVGPAVVYNNDFKGSYHSNSAVPVVILHVV